MGLTRPNAVPIRPLGALPIQAPSRRATSPSIARRSARSRRRCDRPPGGGTVRARSAHAHARPARSARNELTADNRRLRDTPHLAHRRGQSAHPMSRKYTASSGCSSPPGRPVEDSHPTLQRDQARSVEDAHKSGSAPNSLSSRSEWQQDDRHQAQRHVKYDDELRLDHLAAQAPGVSRNSGQALSFESRTSGGEAARRVHDVVPDGICRGLTPIGRDSPATRPRRGV